METDEVQLTLGLITAEFRILRLNGIRATQMATLVSSSDGAAWSEVDAASDLVQDAADGAFDIQIVTPGANERAVTVLFAAQTGSGTADDPYVEHGPTSFVLGTDTPLRERSVVVDSPPTDGMGLPEGTWIVMEEA